MPQDETSDEVILPPKYYHQYFGDLIAFVKKYSHHLLDADDAFFLDQYHSLSEDGQCLFIRFSNRKGHYFRLDKLNYEEIILDDAIPELLHTGFIAEDFDWDAELLAYFTKQELVNAYSDLNIPKTAKKEEVYQIIIDHGHFGLLEEKYPLVQVQFQEAFEYLKLLYFGNYHTQMTEFVIRDIGNVQLEDLSGHTFTAWFETVDEAKAVFEISKLSHSVNQALVIWPASLLHESLQEVDFTKFSRYRAAERRTDKVLLKVARQLEREKEPELALYYYEQAVIPPARERRIRLYYGLKRLEEATTLAEEIVADYHNATELLFAKDFLNRPKIKILRSTTQKIKSPGKMIEVESSTTNKVESLALKKLAEEGLEGIHGENYLWRTLFGLTFWNQLLESGYDSFHHPLQRVSADIYSRDFYEKRSTQIEERLKKLRNKKQWKKEIDATILSKQGINSPLVYWHPEVSDHMAQLVTRLPLPGLKLILIEMAKNFKSNSVGFPDLFVWNESQYHFYEVKSPNDHLSAQQLFWLEFFQACKIKSTVLKVNYTDY
ncbi:MAG: hypothetical protein ACI8QD_000163 [Cyclobacteriaceae bacterium]|jgi:hypothetical protein